MNIVWFPDWLESQSGERTPQELGILLWSQITQFFFNWDHYNRVLFGIVHTRRGFWRRCHSLTFIGCPARPSFIPPRVCNLAHLAFASSDYWHCHKDFSDFLSIFVKLHFLPRFCTLPHTRLDGDNDSIEWSVFAPSVFSRWIQAWILSCVLSASKICTFIASSSGSSPMSADSSSPFAIKDILL